MFGTHASAFWIATYPRELTMRKSLRHLLLTLSVVALAAIGGAVYADVNSTSRSDGAKQEQQSPFFCDVAALSPAARTQHFKVLGPALREKRRAIRALADGYEFEFSSDAQTYQQLVEWVDGERACCPFFDIQLRIAPERGPIVMRLTGRPGTKQFIEADAGPWLTAIGSSH
jgi:hypothetical protein